MKTCIGGQGPEATEYSSGVERGRIVSQGPRGRVAIQRVLYRVGREGEEAGDTKRGRDGGALGGATSKHVFCFFWPQSMRAKVATNQPKKTDRRGGGEREAKRH